MTRLIRLTFGTLVVTGLLVSIVSASTFYPADHGAWAAYPGQATTYQTTVQPPINTDGSSNFKANGKAVIPVKFALSQGTGAFVFKSIGSDTTMANDYSILPWKSDTAFTFNQLTTLIANYQFTTGDCYGGSLRWDVYVDNAVGVIHIYYGNPHGPGQSCSGPNSGSEQNLITMSLSANRFEIGNTGVYTTYAAAQAVVGGALVTGVQPTLDSGWKSD